MCFVFPPHLSSASALPCETENPEIANFHLNSVRCFANEHTKHIQIITWSQLKYPSFPKWSTVCIRQQELIRRWESERELFTKNVYRRYFIPHFNYSKHAVENGLSK